jgi:hypothetical protein
VTVNVEDATSSSPVSVEDGRRLAGGHTGCFGGLITGDRIRRSLGDHVVERHDALDAIDR